MLKYCSVIYAWEQRELSGIASDLVRGPFGGSLKKEIFVSEGYRVYEQQDAIYGAEADGRYYITDEKFDEMSRFAINDGDFIISCSGTIGRIYRLPTNSERGVINQALLKVTVDESRVHPDFFLQYFRWDKFQQSITDDTQGGAIKNLIGMELFKKTKLKSPSISEQTSIGEFFHIFDTAVNLRKRKLEKLKEMKKGYLQRMFPQSGENVPRLRFAEFTERWAEKSLGEISEKVAEKNSQREFTETFTNSAEHGIVSQRDFFDKDISNEKNLDGYFIVRPDDFVYNPRVSNFAPVGPVKRNLLGRTGVMSPLYYVFRVTKGDLSFIEKYFESVYWHEFMKLNGDNGVRADRFNIRDSVFEEMPIPFPSIDEQELVGRFFRNLDSQIIIQQASLNKLKQLKQAYLQKMFV